MTDIDYNRDVQPGGGKVLICVAKNITLNEIVASLKWACINEDSDRIFTIIYYEMSSNSKN